MPVTRSPTEVGDDPVGLPGYSDTLGESNTIKDLSYLVCITNSIIIGQGQVMNGMIARRLPLRLTPISESTQAGVTLVSGRQPVLAK